MNAFVMILNFMNDKWEPCHIIVVFFETINTFGNAMAYRSMMCLQSMGSTFESLHM